LNQNLASAVLHDIQHSQIQSSLPSRRDRIFQWEQGDSPISSSFLSALLPHHRLSPDVWRCGLLTRLLLPIPSAFRLYHCPLCGQACRDDPLLHADKCSKLMYHRHQRLRDSVSHVCRLAGIQTIREGSFRNATRVDGGVSDSEERRVDLLVCFSPKDVALDVTLLSATSPSLLALYPAASPSLFLRLNTADREWRKRKRYEDMCGRNGSKFVPFVLTAGGALGSSAIKFLQNLRSHLSWAALYSRRFPWTSASFFRAAFSHLSTAHVATRMRSLQRLLRVPSGAGTGFTSRSQYENCVSSPGYDVAIPSSLSNAASLGVLDLPDSSPLVVS